MAFAPVASFADLLPKHQFVQGSPFMDEQMASKVGAFQLAGAGMNANAGIRQAEIEGQNLLEAARINAESLARVAKINSDAQVAAGRRGLLTGLAAQGVQRFAGAAFQPPAGGLGGLAGTIGGVNTVLNGLGTMNNLVSEWGAPAQRSVGAALRTTPQPPAFG
jgi:hypothetical protein